jgi:hypothetical protein
MSKPTIPTSLKSSTLGTVEFDTVLSFDDNMESDIPDYPVEDGAYVSDDILKKPLQIQISGIITNMPVTWRTRHYSTDRVYRVSQQLRNIYLKGELLTLIRPDKVYKNMGITSLSFHKENYLNAIEVSLSLKQVTVTQTTAVPISSSYQYSGNTGTTGSTSTSTESSSKKSGSILSNIFGWVKSLFK